MGLYGEATPLVAGAPRVPLPYGLMSHLSPRAGSTDRWESGVRWEQLDCTAETLGLSAVECDPTDMLGLPLQPQEWSSSMAMGEATPFTVMGTFKCSPIGNDLGFAQRQAEAVLALREETALEHELWYGDLGSTPNLTGKNGYAAPTSLGEFALKDGTALAIALLEQHLAETYGSVGMLHMQRSLASYLLVKGGLDVKGNRIVTELGTPVVAGTGYGASKIVATPSLFGYRSDTITNSNRAGDLLDRGKNDLMAVAARTYLLGFDEGCGLASVDLT